MHAVQRTCLVAVSALGLAILGVDGAGSQDATPAAGPPGCTVAPRSEEELAARGVKGTPAPDAAAPLPVAPPEGEPADEGTAAAMTAAVRQIFACLDEGEPLRALALATDAYVARLAAADPLPESEFRAFIEATPPGAPAPERAEPLVREVRVLPDGRAGAVVVEDDPGVPPEGEAAEFWIFARVDGRWLLDEVVASLAEGATPDQGVVATPAA